MNYPALEGRPKAWDDGSLLPAEKSIFNTGYPHDRFKTIMFQAWHDHREYLSHAGRLDWQFALSDVRRIGVSVAFVGIVLPEYTRQFGYDRYLVLVREATGFTPTTDLPGEGDPPVLVFTDDEWEAFVGGVKDREFDPTENRLYPAPNRLRIESGAGIVASHGVIESVFTVTAEGEITQQPRQ